MSALAMNPLDLAIIFLGLGITEAVIKPLAKRVVQRRILKAAPAILRAIDARVTTLINAFAAAIP